VIGVDLAPDGRTALSAGFDGSVRLWDLEQGKELRQLKGHAGGVLSVAVSPDGRTALSGGQDGTLRVWEVGSGRQLRRLTGQRRPGEVRPVPFPTASAPSPAAPTASLRLWGRRDRQGAAPASTGTRRSR